MKTRNPTGKPSWPILLLAGVEKSGKTYAAAEASASDLIGNTYWIGVGEDDPDEYGAIEGARFQIVEHAGTYRAILAAVTEAAAQPQVDGKPNLLVLDSGGRVWALLSDQAQETANERAKRKGRNVSDDGAQITMDLWNDAKQRWGHILDALRSHNGPVIITARLDQVAVMDADGKPTKDKQWKVQAEKNVPFEVGMIVEIRAFGEAYLTGVRSLKFKPKPNEYTRLNDFTVDGLWRNLGLAEKDATSPRVHSGAEPVEPLAERDSLLAEIAALADGLGLDRAEIAAEWSTNHAGQPLRDASDVGGLELLRDDLASKVGASA
jgi:hypothetical protein